MALALHFLLLGILTWTVPDMWSFLTVESTKVAADFRKSLHETNWLVIASFWISDEDLVSCWHFTNYSFPKWYSVQQTDDRAKYRGEYEDTVQVSSWTVNNDVSKSQTVVSSLFVLLLFFLPCRSSSNISDSHSHTNQGRWERWGLVVT